VATPPTRAGTATASAANSQEQHGAVERLARVHVPLVQELVRPALEGCAQQCRPLPNELRVRQRALLLCLGNPTAVIVVVVVATTTTTTSKRGGRWVASTGRHDSALRGCGRVRWVYIRYGAFPKQEQTQHLPQMGIIRTDADGDPMSLCEFDDCGTADKNIRVL
jgi:hypothetical protein